MNARPQWRGSRLPALLDIPAPPAEPATLDPLTCTWAAGQPFWRCIDVNWGSREFNPGSPAHPGRFHPFALSRARKPIATLYAADDQLGALAETVFHDVPVRGRRLVLSSKLVHRLLLSLTPARDLTLVDLRGPGPGRLGLARPELIDSDVRHYPQTAAWARALHAHPATVDGLRWVSRLNDTSECIVLFGDRVSVHDLFVTDGVIPLPLAVGEGFEIVSALALHAGITIAEAGD